jgi:hypothetical protein
MVCAKHGIVRLAFITKMGHADEPECNPADVKGDNGDLKKLSSQNVESLLAHEQYDTYVDSGYRTLLNNLTRDAQSADRNTATRSFAQVIEGELTQARINAHTGRAIIRLMMHSANTAGYRVRAAVSQLEQFVALLKQCAIERITLSREVSIEGLSQLMMDLAATNQEVVRSAPGITLGKVKVLSEKELEAQREMFKPEIKDQLAALEEYRGRSLDDIKNLYDQIKTTKLKRERHLLQSKAGG